MKSLLRPSFLLPLSVSLALTLAPWGCEDPKRLGRAELEREYAELAPFLAVLGEPRHAALDAAAGLVLAEFRFRGDLSELEAAGAAAGWTVVRPGHESLVFSRPNGAGSGPAAAGVRALSFQAEGIDVQFVDMVFRRSVLPEILPKEGSQITFPHLRDDSPPDAGAAESRGP